ncbi:hypothetical protein B0T17DRAFT_523929 [Bombardia bombarda]|uniref:Secreted protein n=1 Tax=Bombardia bombarda TaxID=252184 RepID=A0AA39X7S3_9PEZI|nr:hypothetical protein B0T17DRAFT_523929 [Bombardia bombarda]
MESGILLESMWWTWWARRLLLGASMVLPSTNDPPSLTYTPIPLKTVSSRFSKHASILKTNRQTDRQTNINKDY